MAITITHQPDAALLARAGYVAGAGQDLRWQEEMAQRERMQQRALNYNLLSQQIANQNAVGRTLMGADFAMGRQKQHQDFQRELYDLERQDRLDQIETNFQNRKMEMILQGQSAAEADANEFLFRQSDGHMRMIRSMIEDGYAFDPAEEQKYNAAVQEIQRVMSDPTLRPHQKAQAAYKATELLPIPRIKTRSASEVWNDDVVVQDFPLGDGRTVKILGSTDRDGRPRLLGTLEPDMPKQDEMAGKSIADQVMIDPDKYLKFRAQAVKELTPTGVDAVPEVPSEEKIRKRIEEMLRSAPGGNSPSVTNGESENVDYKWIPGKGLVKSGNS